MNIFVIYLFLFKVFIEFYISVNFKFIYIINIYKINIISYIKNVIVGNVLI